MNEIKKFLDNLCQLNKPTEIILGEGKVGVGVIALKESKACAITFQELEEAKEIGTYLPTQDFNTVGDVLEVTDTVIWIDNLESLAVVQLCLDKIKENLEND